MRALSRRLPIPVPALKGATSYWASVVANPPGHMSCGGVRALYKFGCSRRAGSSDQATTKPNQALSGVQVLLARLDDADEGTEATRVGAGSEDFGDRLMGKRHDQARAAGRKLVRDLDLERHKRKLAEKQASALRAVIARLMAERRAARQPGKSEPEQPRVC